MFLYENVRHAYIYYINCLYLIFEINVIYVQFITTFKLQLSWFIKGFNATSLFRSSMDRSDY